MDEIMDHTKSIDIKQAIDVAIAFLLRCYPDASRILLEETEILTDDKNHWNITLSFQEQDTGYIVLGGKRKYKIFKIDAEKAEVISMKIRELQ
jgi:hypothetical protein